MKRLYLQRTPPPPPRLQYIQFHPSTCRHHADRRCERACTFNATTHKLVPLYRYLGKAGWAADERSLGVKTPPGSSKHAVPPPLSGPITDKYDFLFWACSWCPHWANQNHFRCWKAAKMRCINSMNLSESDLWDTARNACFTGSYSFISTCHFVQYRAPKTLIFWHKRKPRGGELFQPVSNSTSLKESVSIWRRGATMKKNECVNPFSVFEILCVTHGQTRVNLLFFNQFQHDRFSCVFQRASSVAEADKKWGEKVANEIQPQTFS